MLQDLTREELQAEQQQQPLSKLYVPLRPRRKKKKKKKRTKDKCAQKKERKATQTLAIVLGR